MVSGSEAVLEQLCGPGIDLLEAWTSRGLLLHELLVSGASLNEGQKYTSSQIQAARDPGQRHLLHCEQVERLLEAFLQGPVALLLLLTASSKSTQSPLMQLTLRASREGRGSDRVVMSNAPLKLAEDAPTSEWRCSSTILASIVEAG